MEGADFGGYVTKAGLECSDGLTIMPDAFKHMHGEQVPLVWQHDHNSPKHILGHVILEHRADGVYGWGFFNGTTAGENSRELVQHKDIRRMSIFANKVVERSKQVFHGMIREVSLVLAGANPGAVIDYVAFGHSDDDGDLAFLFHSGIEFDFVVGEESGETVEHATGQEVYDSMNEEQKAFFNFVVGQALETQGTVQQSEGGNKPDDKPDDKSGEGTTEGTPGEGAITHQEGNTAVTNVFESQSGEKKEEGYTLSHSDLQGIMAVATQPGQTLKTAMTDFAVKHGIENLDVLFPDAKNLTNTPQFIKRRTEWVNVVLNGVHRSPFSRVKTVWADITQAAARAKGYIKGTYKKDEWFGLTKRTTGPTTVYKKQKLDRDDVIDIVDLDVVVWMKGEMRLMLEEELARAILIGDGRDVTDEDKIKDPVGASEGTGIRSILNDHELFVTTWNVNVDDSGSNNMEITDGIVNSMQFYKGSGSPTFFTTLPMLTKLLLTRDGMQRRLYRTKEDLAAELMVSNIVTVEPMEEITDLIGIIVNLDDYNVGADKGGEVTLFDDFDIDYNQLKYLIETRISGALTRIKSAIVIKKVAASKVLVDPIAPPTYDAATFVVTIPTQTGVTYKNSDTSATLTAGAQAPLAAGASLNVIAVADATHYFSSNAADEWHFERPAA